MKAPAFIQSPSVSSTKRIGPGCLDVCAVIGGGWIVAQERNVGPWPPGADNIPLHITFGTVDGRRAAILEIEEPAKKTPLHVERRDATSALLAARGILKGSPANAVEDEGGDPKHRELELAVLEEAKCLRFGSGSEEALCAAADALYCYELERRQLPSSDGGAR